MTIADLTTTTSTAKLDLVTIVTKIETFKNGELVKVHGYFGGMAHGDCGTFEFDSISKMMETHPEFEGLDWVSDQQQMIKLAGQMTNEVQVIYGSRT
jgi:hypothetical protein